MRAMRTVPLAAIALGAACQLAVPAASALILQFDVEITQKRHAVLVPGDASGFDFVLDPGFVPVLTGLEVEFETAIASTASTESPNDSGGTITSKFTSFGGATITPSPFSAALKDLQSLPRDNTVSASSDSIETFQDVPLFSARTLQFSQQERRSASDAELRRDWSYFILIAGREAGLFGSPDELGFVTAAELLELLMDLRDSAAAFSFSELGLETDLNLAAESFHRVSGTQYLGSATLREIIGEVPEPATLILLGIGLVALAIIALRRRGG